MTTDLPASVNIMARTTTVPSFSIRTETTSRPSAAKQSEISRETGLNDMWHRGAAPYESNTNLLPPADTQDLSAYRTAVGIYDQLDKWSDLSTANCHPQLREVIATMWTGGT